MKQQHAMNKPIGNIKTALILLLLFWVENTALAAPKAELWAFWQQRSSETAVQVDHSPWQQILDQYLKVEGTPEATSFDYAAVTKSHKQQLEDYINTLTLMDVFALSMPQQKAYWINLYNAVTVNLVLDHYPVETIRDIKFGFFSFGPWNEKLITVKGKELSLNDIEHRILRPIWKDPRIHYAVNCASKGCPNLAAKAYSASNTESQLEKAASDYINHKRGVSIDGDTLVLSSIYDWYQVDFGSSESQLIEHLKQYASDGLKSRLSSQFDEVDYEYDWALNAP